MTDEFALDISAKNGEDYVEFASTMLYVKAKLTTVDWMAAHTAVVPVYLFQHGLFSQVDIS